MPPLAPFHMRVWVREEATGTDPLLLTVDTLVAPSTVIVSTAPPPVNVSPTQVRMDRVVEITGTESVTVAESLIDEDEDGICSADEFIWTFDICKFLCSTSSSRQIWTFHRCWSIVFSLVESVPR